MDTIVIRTSETTSEEVQAEVLGNWALNLAVRIENPAISDITLTYVPSGMCIGVGLEDTPVNWDAMRELLKRVDEFVPSLIRRKDGGWGGDRQREFVRMLWRDFATEYGIKIEKGFGNATNRT